MHCDFPGRTAGLSERSTGLFAEASNRRVGTTLARIRSVRGQAKGRCAAAWFQSHLSRSLTPVGAIRARPADEPDVVLRRIYGTPGGDAVALSDAERDRIEREVKAAWMKSDALPPSAESAHGWLQEANAWVAEHKWVALCVIAAASFFHLRLARERGYVARLRCARTRTCHGRLGHQRSARSHARVRLVSGRHRAGDIRGLVVARSARDRKPETCVARAGTAEHEPQ